MNGRITTLERRPARAMALTIHQSGDRLRFALGVSVAVAGAAIALSNLARLLS